VLRTANDADIVALRDLERAANLIALGHIFPPDQYPYPDDDVLARWRIVLDDPGCTTLVADGPDGIEGLVAHDLRTIRHLAVHPDRWGTGLARTLLQAACARIDGPASLWCLVDNRRARGLYEHLGWVPTGLEQESEFAPYPTQMEYVRPPDGWIVREEIVPDTP
jgi:GNAT superfamily N-acetyltransferase